MQHLGTGQGMLYRKFSMSEPDAQSEEEKGGYGEGVSCTAIQHGRLDSRSSLRSRGPGQSSR
eukprot:1916072-Prymnesium_polylepis.1